MPNTYTNITLTNTGTKLQTTLAASNVTINIANNNQISDLIMKYTMGQQKQLFYTDLNQDRGWNSTSSGISVSTTLALTCLSFGKALVDIDSNVKVLGMKTLIFRTKTITGVLGLLAEISGIVLNLFTVKRAVEMVNHFAKPAGVNLGSVMHNAIKTKFISN